MDEKLAKEAHEKKIREMVLVMQLFNHGNVLTFSEGSRVDANNFDCAYPLFKGLSNILLKVGSQKMQTVTSRGS